MAKYLLKRFFLMLPTLFGVALVTFVLIRVIPGDVVELRYSGDRGAVSQEVIDQEVRSDTYDPPVDTSTLAYAVVRLAEAFLFNDAVAGMRGDVDRLREVEAALLGVPVRRKRR